MTNEIQWTDGAVCYVMGMQWLDYGNSQLISEQHTVLPYNDIHSIKDFQLNKIRTEDYITASELDTEQKYNDAVEVFRLFGFGNDSLTGFQGISSGDFRFLALRGSGFTNVNGGLDVKRQLTYPQVMAIGKLKRMMDGREKTPYIKTSGKDRAAQDIKDGRIANVTSNKHERVIYDRYRDSAHVDVYDVLQAFEVTCPATQHAIKKLLCSGLRGHKDAATDLLEAKESINRAVELHENK